MPQPTFFSDGTGRLRTVFRLAIFFVLFVLVQLFAQTVIGVAAAVYYISVENLSLQQIVARLEDPQTLVTLQIVAALPMTLLTHGTVWFCRRYVDKRDMASLGLRRPANGWIACLSLGVVAGLLPIAMAVGVMLSLGEYTAIQPGSVTAINLLLIPTFIVMAYMEEVLCRGYLLQNFIDIRHPVLGFVISNAFFWLAHSLNPHVWTSPVIALNLFFAGVMLSLAYLISGNLWFPTAVHFAWNIAQGVVFGIPVSGIEIAGWLQVSEREGSRELQTGGAFGLEGSVVSLILLGLQIALFAMVLVRNGPAVLPAKGPAEDLASSTSQPVG